MFGTLYTTQDVVSSAYAAALLATFSTAILCFLGLAWTNEKWRCRWPWWASRRWRHRCTTWAPPRCG